MKFEQVQKQETETLSYGKIDMTWNGSAVFYETLNIQDKGDTEEESEKKPEMGLIDSIMNNDDT